MNQMKLGSAGEDVRLMPWTTQQVRNRMVALALAIGAEIDPEASERHRSLAGTIVMPFAQLLIAGTNCQRPLLFPEMVHLAPGEWSRSGVVAV